MQRHLTDTSLYLIDMAFFLDTQGRALIILSKLHHLTTNIR